MRGGYTAVAASACVPAGLLFWQLAGLMLDAAGGKLSHAGLAFSLAIPSVCICMYISVRPTIWTALLCTLTARIMLSYLRDGRRLVLLWLPAVAVAGVNLQAAQWPLLAACAAAFALPYPHELADGAARRAWSARALPICVAVAAMCAASLLNPYGADGSLYVLKSLGEAAYGGAIVEMQPLWVQLGPLFAVPVATMALGPIALCRRSGARVPAGAAAMLLAGIAAGVLHSRCMWIAGLFCGLCCAFGLAGALGEPVAHPGRAAAAAGAAMALIAAVSGLAVSLAPQSGGEAGMLSVTESEMSPIFSAIRRRTRRAGVLQRRLGVQPARVGGLQGALRHAPRDLGRGHRRRRGGVRLPRDCRRPPGVDLAGREYRGLGLGAVPRQGR